MSRSNSLAGLAAGLAASVFLVNAIQRLSGLKFGVPETPSTWKASAPGASRRRNQMVESSSAPRGAPGSRRRDENASSFPSGLKRGDVELNAGLVRRRGGSPPSVEASQISL